MREITKMVRELLESNLATRNSDSLLYVKVCQKVNPEVGNMRFDFVMENRKALGLPGFESVRRARQKLQEHHPDLSADANVEAGRIVREEEMRGYARQVSKRYRQHRKNRAKLWTKKANGTPRRQKEMRQQKARQTYQKPI